jgi:hypothetical protein
VVGLVIVLPVFVASLILRHRGRRLMDGALPAVVAEPDPSAAAHAQLGPVRPDVEIGVVLGFVVAAAIGMPWWTGDIAQWWILEVLALVQLVRFARLGPASLPLGSAYLDEVGVRIPQLGLRLPGESVTSFRVSVDGVDITVGGPLDAVGGWRQQWVERAAAAYPPGSTIRLNVPEPELAYRTARRFALAGVVTVVGRRGPVCRTWPARRQRVDGRRRPRNDRTGQPLRGSRTVGSRPAAEVDRTAAHRRDRWRTRIGRPWRNVSAVTGRWSGQVTSGSGSFQFGTSARKVSPEDSMLATCSTIAGGTSI